MAITVYTCLPQHNSNASVANQFPFELRTGFIRMKNPLVIMEYYKQRSFYNLNHRKYDVKLSQAKYYSL